MITNNIGTFAISESGISVQGGTSFLDETRAFVVRDNATDDPIGYFTGIGRQVRLASDDGADLALRPADGQNLRLLNIPTSAPGGSNGVYTVNISGHNVLAKT